MRTPCAPSRSSIMSRNGGSHSCDSDGPATCWKSAHALRRLLDFSFQLWQWPHAGVFPVVQITALPQLPSSWQCSGCLLPFGSSDSLLPYPCQVSQGMPSKASLPLRLQKGSTPDDSSSRLCFCSSTSSGVAAVPWSLLLSWPGSRPGHHPG